MRPSTDRTFVIATSNPGKRREFEQLLGDFFEPNWQIYDRTDYPGRLHEVVESAETFEGNAIKKAVETADQTGCCALADDSGLQVDALDGAPGVRSARFAGEDATDEQNNRLLIERLKGVARDQRSAQFVAVVALALPDNAVADALMGRIGLERDKIDANPADAPGRPAQMNGQVVVWFRGQLEGEILEAPRGQKGFGYDPLFYVPQLGGSAAEMTLEEKNRFSHRAAAVDQLVQFFS